MAQRRNNNGSKKARAYTYFFNNNTKLQEFVLACFICICACTLATKGSILSMYASSMLRMKCGNTIGFLRLWSRQLNASIRGVDEA